MPTPSDRDTYEFLRGLEAGTKSVPDPGGGSPLRSMIHHGGGSGFGGWLRSILPGSDYDYQSQAGDLWRNGAVAACLRVYKANFPQPELQVRKRKASDGGKGKVVPRHKLTALINRPNKAYDRFSLWSSFCTAALCDGNAYLVKVRSAAQIPVELWWVPPWMLRPLWDSAGVEYVAAYEYLVNGRSYYLRPADVIHYRHGGPDPRNERLAMSELKAAAARSVCGLNEVDGYTASIMRNMGIVGAYVRPAFEGGRIVKDDADLIKDQWRERTTGERRGDLFVNPGTFVVDKLGFSPEELSLDKIPARLEDQISALTGVPAMLAGLTSGAQHKTYANYGEARRSFYEDTLIPMQAAVAECLEHNLLDDVGVGNGETEEVCFSYDRIMCLTEDQDKVWTRAAAAYEKGGIRRSEYRDIIGLEWDAADEVYFVEPGAAGEDPNAPDPGEEGVDDAADPDETGRAEAKAVGRALKFNPNHGPDGQFTGHGGVAVSHRPGLREQVEAHRAAQGGTVWRARKVLGRLQKAFQRSRDSAKRAMRKNTPASLSLAEKHTNRADVLASRMMRVAHFTVPAKSLEGDDRRPFAGPATKDQADRGAGDGAIPAGDEPEDHEDNTFGLPDGTPIRRELKRWFRRIALEVLGNLPAIGAPAPHGFPALADYAAPMAAAMTPLLSAYWDEGGKVTRARLGLDPAEWRVVDPHLHDAIEAQGHAFCQSTLQSTADTVQEAYRKLNLELIAGLVTEGEAVPKLAERVRSVFTGLSKTHASLIARTEASRAVHAASEMSAKESGVVSGKVWLLSSNACPLCHELEAKSKAHPIPLGGEFASVGNNPAYSSIRMPPGHPRCRCSATYRLTTEYQATVDAHPPATFDPGPLGPEPRPKPEPQPEPAVDALGLSFAPSDAARSAKQRTVVVGVRALDEAWRRDTAYYVPPGGGSAPQKYQNAVDFISRARTEGTEVEQPQVAVDEDGTASITDGRHRFAAMRDMGARAVPVSVDRAQAARARLLLGADKQGEA